MYSEPQGFGALTFPATKYQPEGLAEINVSKIPNMLGRMEYRQKKRYRELHVTCNIEPHPHPTVLNISHIVSSGEAYAQTPCCRRRPQRGTVLGDALHQHLSTRNSPQNVHPHRTLHNSLQHHHKPCTRKT